MSDLVRILHVDGDPKFKEMTAKFLKQESDQFVLIGESTSTDARERVIDTEDEIDCVVSDYALPDMNGIELLKSIRDEFSDLPFILFTGKGSEAVARDALRAGATDYLQKQSGTEQYDLLANQIRNAVEQSRADRRITEYETVIDTVPDGVYIFDDSFEFTMVNDRLVELTGYARDELVGSHASLVFDEEAIERGERNRERLRDGRSEYGHVSTEIGTASGGTVPVEVRASPLDPDTEETIKTAGVVRDVTEQRERERQLETTIARFEALFEQSPDMIDILDPAGNILEANYQFREKIGYEEDELVGRGIWTIDRRVDEDDVAELLSDLDIGGRRRFEGRPERRDGSAFPVEVHLIRVDLQGEDRFLAISRDITERKEQERKREQIISRVTDAIVEVDADWRFTLVNEQAEKLYDTEADELLGRNFWDVFSEARGTRFEDEYRAVMETREPTSLVD